MTKLYDGMVLKKTFTILHIQNKVVCWSNYTGILIPKYRKSRCKHVHMQIIKSPLSFSLYIKIHSSHSLSSRESGPIAVHLSQWRTSHLGMHRPYSGPLSSELIPASFTLLRNQVKQY